MNDDRSYWEYIIVGIIILLFIGIKSGFIYDISGNINNIYKASTDKEVSQEPSYIPIGPEEKPTTYTNLFCDKIDPYDLKVRTATSMAVRNHPGEYNINQLLDIYDWVKLNIHYLNVPLDMNAPYHPSETLTTLSGDCKNQAVLIASMVESIGGHAKVIAQPSCEHAYTMVYFAPIGTDMQSYVNTIAEHYGKALYVTWVRHDGGNWVIFDPAGGKYPGNTLPECSNGKGAYFIESCISS